ncbi:889a13fa-8c2d-4da2-ab25-aa8d7116cce4 [Thermothielavioides terrestris]|nr:889a13fa-8c2d-4da2-ab25-aa8d7116cce4 [Thermothielavioides terrestris]
MRESSIQVWVYKRAHVVVGEMSAGEPREIWSTGSAQEALFGKVRRVARELWPWWKRLLSLKSIQGFALYRCYLENESHEAGELDDEAGAVLYELWHDYNHMKKDGGGRGCLGTTTQNAIISATAEESRVNGGQADKAPCLALSLCVKWSVQKIAI